ncbi:hypothetical protein ACFQU7_18355 [Pseudoroseomonas wenyumeiae]
MPNPSAPRWTAASETAHLREVLVCPPDHYRWLPTNTIARRTLAESRQAPAQHHLMAQHAELVAAMEQAGVGSTACGRSRTCPTWSIRGTAWW